MHTDASAPQNGWIQSLVTAVKQDWRQAMTANASIYLPRNRKIEQPRERHILFD